MKKILCILVAAITLFTLCACGSPKSDDTSAADVQKVEFTAGSWDGSVYTNEFADITYNQPDDWTHYTDEQLAQQMQISVDVLSDKKAYNEQIAKLPTAYCVIANGASGACVQIFFQNLEASEEKDMTPEEYLDVIFPMLEQMYAQYGFTCKVSDVSKLTIGSQEYDYADISVESQGKVIKQAYLCRKVDNYICSFALTAQSEDEIKDMINCFE